MDAEPVIAVTGANGYVGSIIAEALAAEGPVIRLGRTVSGPGAIPWSFDTEAATLAKALKDHEVTHVVHAAWDMQASGMADQRRSSIAGSLRLIEACRLADIAHPVFISSISAFDGARSSYGQSKLAVERAFLAEGGTVLRLGLVYGADRPGGAFGTIRDTVRKSRFVPMIGSGAAPQYLLDAATLGQAVRRAVTGDLNETGGPITIARPDPLPFRDLVRGIAKAEDRQVTPIPLPWPLLYAGLRTAELIGVKLGVRSDSVVSFVFQDQQPDFGPMQRNGILPAEPRF
jgi:nucleoside-diphosphate-sugar epimerase